MPMDAQRFKASMARQHFRGMGITASILMDYGELVDPEQYARNKLGTEPELYTYVSQFAREHDCIRLDEAVEAFAAGFRYQYDNE